MKAIWLVPPFVTPSAPRENPEQALLACPLANARLRTGVAALKWKQCGNENVYWDPCAANASRGLDMTRRDIQGEAKKMGRPWEMGKAFDNSAPCTALKTVAMVWHPAKGTIWHKVSGKVTQKGDLSELIWNVPGTISHLYRLITLRAGEFIMSGTPAGVGPVRPATNSKGTWME